MTLTKVNKLPVFLAVAASVIFLFAAFRQHGDGTTLPDAANKILEFGRSRPSFYEIAIKTGTDKVTDHSYHHMYQKYLPAIRNRKIKMLEIGLGCDMSYGPGASVSLLTCSSTFHSLPPSQPHRYLYLTCDSTTSGSSISPMLTSTSSNTTPLARRNTVKRRPAPPFTPVTKPTPHSSKTSLPKQVATLTSSLTTEGTP